MRRYTLAIFCCAAVAGTAGAQPLRPTGIPADLPKIQVTSVTFPDHGRQPRSAAFAACGGQNISPELHWSGAPAGTKSFVVTEFDPDAPTGVGFWHWLLADIPPSVSSLAAGAPPPPGAIAGMTDHGLPGYQGPCPPLGDRAHRYKFTVSALNIAALPGMTQDSTGASVSFSLRGHVIAQGSYYGLYSR